MAHTEFEQNVLRRRVRVSLDNIELWVASPEDLIIYKLIAARTRDVDDATELIATRGTQLDWP